MNLVHQTTPLLRPGDRVAILSLSGRGPARFPATYELGLRRIEAMGLRPVEYSTTRSAVASPSDRARDLTAAWTDPDIAGVLTTIGGRDQHLVIPLLEPDLFATAPKRFLGYSDNTQILGFLDRCGVRSLHGGVVMVEWARPGGMHPITEESLRRALFTGGKYVLPLSVASADDAQCDWHHPETLDHWPKLYPVLPPLWSGPNAVADGLVCGGALEALETGLELGLIGQPGDFDGRVLLIETSLQEPPEYVERVLNDLHEHGLLRRVAAVLVGRPRAWTHDKPWPPHRRAAYVREQRNRVSDVLERLAPQAVVVQGLDLGHTDPQVVIPIGGRVRVEPDVERVIV